MSHWNTSPLNLRGLAGLLALAGVVGAMAFLRTRQTPASVPVVLVATGASLPGGQVAPLMTENQAQEQVALHVAPAVVQVNVTAHASHTDSDNPLSQFFGPLGPLGPQGPGPQGEIGPHGRAPQFEQGVGSGVILSPDGYIVTNNHVVDGATDIKVKLKDNRIFNAKLVGADAISDLAIIKIDAAGLPNLPWGDSRKLKQGDTVFAFGNPFGSQMSFTMTRGIVSGLGRLAPGRSDAHQPGDYIQTDAAINPGNSGGPLVDIHGDVIGINAFIYTATGTFSGAGFAIPSEVANPIAVELAAHGKIVRSYLGVAIVDMDPEQAPFFHVPADQHGALVEQVDPDTPAAKAGLQPGDVITAFNGTPVDNISHLQIMTGRTAPGTRVSLEVLRDGKPMSVPATLETLPDTAPAPGAMPVSASNNSGSSGAQLGIQMSDLTPDTRHELHLPDDLQGVAIEDVTEGGPAFNADLGQGDVITQVNRVPIHNGGELLQQLKAIPANKNLLLTVFQQQGEGLPGVSRFVVVSPAELPGGPGDSVGAPHHPRR